MSKKNYYLMIFFSHLTVLISLIFPLIKVDELRIGVEGAENTESYFINVISYINNEIYPLTALFMMGLIVLEFVGIVNALVGFFSKKLTPLNIKLAFVYGFSSAIFAALLLYSSSGLLFLIFACSFAIISYASIKLLMAEEKQEDSK